VVVFGDVSTWWTRCFVANLIFTVKRSVIETLWNYFACQQLQQCLSSTVTRN